MTVTERVTGVLTLRPSVFEDIEADKHANAIAQPSAVNARSAGAGSRGAQSMSANSTSGSLRQRAPYELRVTTRSPLRASTCSRIGRPWMP